jgi:hypothetical protein
VRPVKGGPLLFKAEDVAAQANVDKLIDKIEKD